MQVRPFLPSDIPACSRIVTLSLGVENGRMAERDLDEGISSPNASYQWCERVVAEDEGVVGVCGAYHLRTHPWDHAGICWYAVLPEWRRRGIGAELLREAERLAKFRGYRSIFAWTISSAIGYYERNGYVEISPDSIVPKESYLLVRKPL